MTIDFTGEVSWNIDGWLSFRAFVDGHAVTNRVPVETLQDYFESDASRAGDEAAYIRHRSRIDAIAEGEIRAGHVNKFGGADLTPEVVERYGERMR